MLFIDRKNCYYSRFNFCIFFIKTIFQQISLFKFTKGNVYLFIIDRNILYIFLFLVVHKVDCFITWLVHFLVEYSKHFCCWKCSIQVFLAICLWCRDSDFDYLPLMAISHMTTASHSVSKLIGIKTQMFVRRTRASAFYIWFRF